MEKNAKVTTTTVTQPANKILGTTEKTIGYLIIETDKGKHVINVGAKTIDLVNQITSTK